jgi:MHS family shikimate/dehydroshikimate transporter-like MFS transporter
MGEELKGKNTRFTVLASSMIGTAIEQYDFLLYGAAAALIFNKLFFPSMDAFAGTIAALGTYAAGFVARPLGGIIFGHLGDKIGRKSILMLTLTLMGIASTAIGLLPTYGSVGIWAPILLVLLRIIQGIALGGEQGGAILIAVENAPDNKRGFWGAFGPAGSSLGIVLSFGAISLAASLSGPEFATWGWRVPFIASIVLVALGLLVRSKLDETPAFAKIVAQKKQATMPLIELVRNYPRELFVTFGVRFGDIGWATITLILTTSYATAQLNVPRTVVLNAIVIAALVAGFTLPIIGALSDRFGRKPFIILAGALMILFAWPYFLMLQTRDPLWIMIAITLSWGFLTPLTYATESAFFGELFETRVRYSGVNAGQQLSGVISAGLLPVFGVSALQWTGGDPWPIAGFGMFMGLVIVISALAAHETYEVDLDAVVPRQSALPVAGAVVKDERRAF